MSSSNNVQSNGTSNSNKKKKKNSAKNNTQVEKVNGTTSKAVVPPINVENSSGVPPGASSDEEDSEPSSSDEEQEPDASAAPKFQTGQGALGIPANEFYPAELLKSFRAKFPDEKKYSWNDISKFNQLDVNFVVMQLLFHFGINGDMLDQHSVTRQSLANKASELEWMEFENYLEDLSAPPSKQPRHSPFSTTVVMTGKVPILTDLTPAVVETFCQQVSAEWRNSKTLNLHAMFDEVIKALLSIQFRGKKLLRPDQTSDSWLQWDMPTLCANLRLAYPKDQGRRNKS